MPFRKNLTACGFILASVCAASADDDDGDKRLKRRIASLEAKVAALESRQGTFEERLSSVESVFGALEAQIGDLQTADGELMERVQALEEAGGGATGYEFVSRIFVPFAAGVNSDGIACPAGKRALGGGYRVESNNPNVFVAWDTPIDGGLGWFFRVNNQTGGTQVLSLYVLCASFPD